MKKFGISRLSSLAGALLKTAASGWWGKLRHRDADGWGPLNPETIEAAVKTFGELKGLPMKLGQILSYVDNALPENALSAFAVLQRQSKPLPFESVIRILLSELPETAAELMMQMDHEPVASASIGQVYYARLNNDVQVAVKVQYPGIREAIASEMKVAASGAGVARILAPGAGVDQIIAEVRDRLLEECDYRNEATNQNQFHANFASHPVIRVPMVFERFSSGQVLTSEWVEGQTFDAWLEANPSQAERDRIGKALYEFYIVSLYRFGMFNADPHPGNYVITPANLWFLDFGCVRKFPPLRVLLMRKLSAAVQAGDEQETKQALYDLGVNQPLRAPYPQVRDLLRGFFAPILVSGPSVVLAPSATGFGDMLASKKLLLSLRLPPDLLFLIRIKYGLYSILARSGARCDWALLVGLTRLRCGQHSG